VLMPLEIRKYKDTWRKEMLALWEKSVRATHDFLDPADIDFFKNIVQGIDFNSFEVYCAFEGKEMIGILGVHERKLEMLFLDPDHIGKGYGKELMNFILNDLRVTKVDVNEGNHNATEFYKRFGFRVYERTDVDDHGKPYPILKMELQL
jgi:putative acetyltransferase